MARSSQNSNSGARKGKRPSLVPAARKRRPQLPPEEIDWKNFPSLRRFLSERGKIRSRRITGLSRRQQSELARAVKRARTMGLFPYPDQERNLREKTVGGPSTTSTRTAPSGEHEDRVDQVEADETHAEAVGNIEGVEVVSED